LLGPDRLIATLCTASTNCFRRGSLLPRRRKRPTGALALDDGLADPHAAIGYVKERYDWDWPGAELEFKRAIELNPNDAAAHYWYAQTLADTGRLDDAIAEAKRAQEADPVSLMASASPGAAFYFARRYTEAIDQYRKTIEMDPNFYMAHWWVAMSYAQAGRYEEAIAEGQKALGLYEDAPPALGVLGNAFALSGKRAQAQKVLAKLKDLSRRRYVGAT
jgi:serine/threonine-protein kinase